MYIYAQVKRKLYLNAKRHSPRIPNIVSICWIENPLEPGLLASEGSSHAPYFEDRPDLSNNPSSSNHLSHKSQQQSHHRSTSVQLLGERSEPLWDFRWIRLSRHPNNGRSWTNGRSRCRFGGGGCPVYKGGSDHSRRVAEGKWGSVDESGVHF